MTTTTDTLATLYEAKQAAWRKRLEAFNAYCSYHDCSDEHLYRELMAAEKAYEAASAAWWDARDAQPLGTFAQDLDADPFIRQAIRDESRQEAVDLIGDHFGSVGDARIDGFFGDRP